MAYTNITKKKSLTPLKGKMNKFKFNSFLFYISYLEEEIPNPKINCYITKKVCICVCKKSNLSVFSIFSNSSDELVNLEDYVVSSPGYA